MKVHLLFTPLLALAGASRLAEIKLRLPHLAAAV